MAVLRLAPGERFVTSTWNISDDISTPGVALACTLAALSVGLLLREFRRADQQRVWVLATGILSSLLLLLAVLRPVTALERSLEMGAKVVVLVDGSRRLLLPADGQTSRAEVASQVVTALGRHFKKARVSVLRFAEALDTYDPKAAPSAVDSDLKAALDELLRSEREKPAAIVVVSDGRVSRPTDVEALSDTLNELNAESVALHAVSVAERGPPDASIRAVRAAGAAVAHQALTLTVEVGCSGGLTCGEIPVRVTELLSGEAPVELSAGAVRVEEGVGAAEFELTLDRSGARVVQVAIDTPSGDAVPENDTRLLTFSVAKERVRLLHLAGRPTYDVRALRTWLKSDDSVDVVAFFILRGETDDPVAGERDLSLIRFPVDELFTEHLPSFDAVILQDIDAIKYRLSRYLVRLERYVKEGGGLIMVGGPSSFGGGKYAGTPLDSILPVEQPRGGETADPGTFVPSYTAAGRAAPVTRKLRSLLQGELPEMVGANILGEARPGAIVLWEHPRLTAGERGMPLLALGEAGDGRAIALGVDGTHTLAFGELAARASGRGYGALWDGLLGWLMHDPRYEAARVELVAECIAGVPATLRVHRLPGMAGDVTLTVESLTRQPRTVMSQTVPGTGQSLAEVVLPALPAGGYSARVVVGPAPATRHDFGCEAAGRAWADTRPNPDLLRAITERSGGAYVRSGDEAELPMLPPTRVNASRKTAPWLPVWVWTLLASVALGAHWLVRRQGGLS